MAIPDKTRPCLRRHNRGQPNVDFGMWTLRNFRKSMIINGHSGNDMQIQLIDILRRLYSTESREVSDA